MLQILTKFNYRNIRFAHDCTGETISVRRKDGSFVAKRYLGYVGARTAKELKGRPVKLEIYGWSKNFESIQEVPKGSYVQGCLIDSGVFIVLDERGEPRVV